MGSSILLYNIPGDSVCVLTHWSTSNAHQALYYNVNQCTEARLATAIQGQYAWVRKRHTVQSQTCTSETGERQKHFQKTNFQQFSRTFKHTKRLCEYNNFQGLSSMVPSFWPIFKDVQGLEWGLSIPKDSEPLSRTVRILICLLCSLPPASQNKICTLYVLAALPPLISLTNVQAPINKCILWWERWVTERTSTSSTSGSTAPSSVGLGRLGPADITSRMQSDKLYRSCISVCLLQIYSMQTCLLPPSNGWLFGETMPVIKPDVIINQWLSIIKSKPDFIINQWLSESFSLSSLTWHLNLHLYASAWTYLLDSVCLNTFAWQCVYICMCAWTYLHDSVCVCLCVRISVCMHYIISTTVSFSFAR